MRQTGKSDAHLKDLRMCPSWPQPVCRDNASLERAVGVTAPQAILTLWIWRRWQQVTADTSTWKQENVTARSKSDQSNQILMEDGSTWDMLEMKEEMKSWLIKITGYRLGRRKERRWATIESNKGLTAIPHVASDELCSEWQVESSLCIQFPRPVSWWHKQTVCLFPQHPVGEKIGILCGISFSITDRHLRHLEAIPQSVCWKSCLHMLYICSKDQTVISPSQHK